MSNLGFAFLVIGLAYLIAVAVVAAYCWVLFKLDARRHKKYLADREKRGLWKI
jgi:hypothetical protein